jgi:hypothetical protein
MMGSTTANSDGGIWRRSLSLVHPVAKAGDTDTVASTGDDSSSSSSSGTTGSKIETTSSGSGGGSIASKTSSTSSGSSGDDTSTSSRNYSGPTSSSSGTGTASGTTTNTLAAGKISASNSTQTNSMSSTTTSTSKSSNTTTTTSNSTSHVPTQPTDPGEPEFDRPLPTVYAYGDDDNPNSHGYKITRPLNPVVDDILQFLDDDAYKKNSTRLFPEEKEEPAMWPVIVAGIFVATAVVLCAATAYKNYRKRKNYQEIPTSLTV